MDNAGLKKLEALGYYVVSPLFNSEERKQIMHILENNDAEETTHIPKVVHGMRRVLSRLPELKKHLFTRSFSTLMESILGKEYALIKSIYFDKPPGANWAVPYHQDISVALINKNVSGDYHNWLRKEDYWSVNAPESLLNRIYTFRIHLDETDETNGALKVMSGSHLSGITRTIPNQSPTSSEEVVVVEAGGVMVMRPLLWHASSKSNAKRRRVIHLEFYKQPDEDLPWAEYVSSDELKRIK